MRFFSRSGSLYRNKSYSVLLELTNQTFVLKKTGMCPWCKTPLTELNFTFLLSGQQLRQRDETTMLSADLKLLTQSTEFCFHLFMFCLMLFPRPCFFPKSSTLLWPLAALISCSVNLAPSSVIPLTSVGGPSNKRGAA